MRNGLLGGLAISLAAKDTVAGGSANLKADCNQVQWTYTLEDSSLTFNTVGPSTLAFCGDDSLDQMFLSKLGMGGAEPVLCAWHPFQEDLCHHRRRVEPELVIRPRD